MAAIQNFRSALNGFNREDVVHYIEYINNKHTSQVNQLKTEMKTMEEELTALRQKPDLDPTLPQQLQQSQERCAALEAELAQAKEAAAQELEVLRNQLEQARTETAQNSELEAYRRAERAERMANERVAQLYQQANGALADATVKADEAASQIGTAADRVAAQLTELQAALTAGKTAMKDAAASLYAVRPLTSEE